MNVAELPFKILLVAAVPSIVYGMATRTAWPFSVWLIANLALFEFVVVRSLWLEHRDNRRWFIDRKQVIAIVVMLLCVTVLQFFLWRQMTN